MANAATTPTLPATPAKLNDGSWGAKVKSSDVAIGDSVTITTRGGKSWEAIVDAVFYRQDDGCLCRTRKSTGAKAGTSLRKASAPRARTGGRCRSCRGAIRDAAHHRAMGGLCGGCAFDEYDC